MNKNNIVEVHNINFSYTLRRPLSIKGLFTLTESRITFKVDALRDVSFSLEKGNNLGIIGMNGSGKSSLLRIISGTYRPDFGNLIVNSVHTYLLTLGTGYMSRLTGRDNLYLNALMLGFSKTDLHDGLSDKMIEFSELGEAIDRPMYSYSSGMCSRLMFSIAACVWPDLLLLDEVFSVGDAGFIEKSAATIQKIINSDQSVIMVSHDAELIARHCRKILWLHKGQVQMFDDVDIVAKEYKRFVLQEAY